MRKHNTPFVLVDRMSEVRCDQVGTENEAVSVALVEHLLELGHRRVGMLTGLAGLSTTGERVHGYLRAHEALGHPVDKQLIVPGLSTVAGGRSAVNTLLRLRQRPTAIFSGNNAMTIGALLALKQARLSIPDEMALVTFDDFEWAERHLPCPHRGSAAVPRGGRPGGAAAAAPAGRPVRAPTRHPAARGDRAPRELWLPGRRPAAPPGPRPPNRPDHAGGRPAVTTKPAVRQRSRRHDRRGGGRGGKRVSRARAR